MRPRCGVAFALALASGWAGHPARAAEERPRARELEPPAARAPSAGGSCRIVLATDAPLDARQLRRLAARSIHGMGPAGSSGSHGSGDDAIAFPTTRRFVAGRLAAAGEVAEDALSPLLQSAIEATEEAILNSLLRATAVRGAGGHVAEAIPIDRGRDPASPRELK